MIQGKNRVVEGTDYMGRVLLSMNLIQQDDPDCGVESLNGHVEPDSQEYEVRIEGIEMNLYTEYEKVWIEAKFGANMKKTKEIKFKRSGQTEQDEFKTFKFTGSKGQIDEIRATYPIDKGQVPDIFLNVYAKKLFKTERLGYIRIKASHSDNTHNKPRWYHFRNPVNHEEGSSPGSLLANVRLLSGG
jgi:hypothetical protein